MLVPLRKKGQIGPVIQRFVIERQQFWRNGGYPLDQMLECIGFRREAGNIVAPGYPNPSFVVPLCMHDELPHTHLCPPAQQSTNLYHTQESGGNLQVLCLEERKRSGLPAVSQIYAARFLYGLRFAGPV